MSFQKPTFTEASRPILSGLNKPDPIGSEWGPTLDRGIEFMFDLPAKVLAALKSSPLSPKK